MNARSANDRGNPATAGGLYAAKADAAKAGAAGVTAADDRAEQPCAVPSRARLMSRDEPQARATEPPALQCDRCQGEMAFVMTVFQTRVFECAQCKKVTLIPAPQDGE
jgi:hypothetical protein